MADFGAVCDDAEIVDYVIYFGCRACAVHALRHTLLRHTLCSALRVRNADRQTLVSVVRCLLANHQVQAIVAHSCVTHNKLCQLEKANRIAKS